MISKKSVEMAIKTGVMVNVTVYEPRTNRMEERFYGQGFTSWAIKELKEKRADVNGKRFFFN